MTSMGDIMEFRRSLGKAIGPSKLEKTYDFNMALHMDQRRKGKDWHWGRKREPFKPQWPKPKVHCVFVSDGLLFSNEMQDLIVNYAPSWVKSPMHKLFDITVIVMLKDGNSIDCTWDEYQDLLKRLDDNNRH